jgi:hypothetical protein
MDSRRLQNEAHRRWGDTETYRESERRTSRYTQKDFDQAFGNSLPVQSEQTQNAVRAHREAITKWFYPCSVQMQKNLALMYLEDSRFKEYYEGRVRGLAQYVHDSIMAQQNI